MNLSVIIPVYNVFATLIRCVDSVVIQDVPQLELILVDDGSTDGSSGLCDNIQRQYTDEQCTIRVIHQANAGLSAARNAGLAACTGELVTFVDSDDFLEKDTYAPLLSLFAEDEEVDVVEFPVDIFYNVVTERHELNFPRQTFSSPLDYLFQARGVMHSYACNKVFRRCLFDCGRPYFPVGRAFEDVFTLPLWLAKARKITTTESGCYFYTLNTQGICQTAGRKQYEDRFEALVALMEWIPISRRNGKAYCQIYEQALNVRKDSGEALPIAPNLAPSIWTMPWRCMLKHLRYKVGL